VSGYIRDGIPSTRSRISVLKAKFHYASWFGAGSELVRSWFELKFGLSSSLLAANQLELARSRPNSITLSDSKLVRSWFETDSVMEFGFNRTGRKVASSMRSTLSPLLLTAVQYVILWFQFRSESTDTTHGLVAGDRRHLHVAVYLRSQPGAGSESALYADVPPRSNVSITQFFFV